MMDIAPAHLREHCPDAGFRAPSEAAHIRPPRRLDLALLVALCLSLGFLVGVGFAVLTFMSER